MNRVDPARLEPASVPAPGAVHHHLVVEPEAAGERLDRYLARILPEISRSRVQQLIESGDVLLGRRRPRASEKLGAGDELEVVIPPPAPATPRPESIPLHVVYEDDDVAVIDKPAGLVVHPAPGHAAGTLVNALLARFPEMVTEPVGSEERPGIVHRLDKDTSGLMVIAKTARAYAALVEQLRRREMDKRYLALVDGTPPSQSGTIDAPLSRHAHGQRMAIAAGGREAITQFRVLRRYPRHSLLECKLVTGRTHQIRVHLAAISCPVVGDRTYGRKQPTIALDRHFLHAARLTFKLPSGEERAFEAPLPPELQAALDGLGE